MARRAHSRETTAEHRRLAEADRGEADWRRWGPYLSERQWGTVREDYSHNGNAWSYFPHEHARSRAYRWGEDGIAGISDDQQRLCLALALWNERDPFLKERLFGLTGAEGNHGEDVKEYYYLDATPTHAYLKMLYKYPQGVYPYQRLRDENPHWKKLEPEFELIDSGLFDENRYFDVFVEYAKASPNNIVVAITVHNRGPETAPLHLLPTLWFRNTWSWNDDAPKPEIAARKNAGFEAHHATLGTVHLYCEGNPRLLACDNETNAAAVFEVDGDGGFYKDGINDFVVNGDASAVNPKGIGTKTAAHFRAEILSGGAATFRLRLTDAELAKPFEDADAVLIQAREEADAFYADLQRDIADADARLVQRQALAGMIWTKQFYHYDVRDWLSGDPAQPAPPAERWHGRNADWDHVNTADILSMPDKWEYPWFAAWDSAFHCLPLTLVDPEFAKDQLVLFSREWYTHPNGQLPAYEWNFGDVNPPVRAWATWRVFQIDRRRRGDAGDLRFLERVFRKLLLNFTWWVNRKSIEGRNIFQGGFLGLDNIGVFDRSKPLPTGGHINQADGTSWMAMYCLNMMRIALELARHNNVYEDIATKFFEHFLHIAEAMTDFQRCGTGLWDEQDQFYYDMLRTDDGAAYPMRLRSMVGLIPLFAVEVLEPDLLDALPEFHRRLKWFLDYRPDLAALVSRWEEPGVGERHLLSLLRGHRMKRLFARLLDESEFLSDYGVRVLSKVHEAEPFRFGCGGEDHLVTYLPAESDSYMFGGNSNWRGPIWMPVNFLLVESMQRFHHFYGDDFKIECPVGSGRRVTILEASEELTRRLTRIFLRDADGRRAMFGDVEKFQTDLHFRDYVPFYEYFHGDTGRGVGASHQTGWTGLIAKLIQPRRQPH